MTYTPSRTPTVSTLEELRRWVEQEFLAVSRAFSETTTLELRATFRAPDHPRTGMIVYADGTLWNPGGTGAGVYVWTGSAWSKL